MGNRQSGEVSDMSFIHAVEKSIALNREIQDHHGVLLYARYRDDIICFQDGAIDNSMRFFNKISQKALEKGFNLKLEQESRGRFHIDFLDVSFFLDDTFALSRRVCWRLFQKPTGQKVPLSEMSAHSKSVLRHWPISEIQRFKRRCIYRKEFEECAKGFIARLQNFSFSKKLIESVKASIPDKCIMPTQAPDLIREDEDLEGDCPKKVFWVIPFHPEIQRLGLAKIVREEMKKWSLPSIEVTISWKNYQKNLDAQIRRTSHMSAVNIYNHGTQ